MTLEHVTAAVKSCMEAWDEGFRTGDTSRLETFPADHYQGIFAHAGQVEVEPVDRTDAIQGVRQFAGALHPAAHQAESMIIRMRSDEEAAVFYERIISKNGNRVASFLVLQTWRLIDGAWRVVREVAEHVG